MNGLPYYKAYPRDFVEGTIGMPFELKAAYRLLLDLIYMQGGNLPDEPRYISGLLGCSVKKWNLLREQLLSIGKIETSGKFLTNLRAQKELEILRKFQDKQSENASLPRKSKELAQPSLNHTEPEPDNIKKETPIVPKGTAKRKEDEEWFDESVRYDYPRKTPRIPALRAWMRLTAAEKAQCARAVTEYSIRFDDVVSKSKRSREEELQYVPHLSTFINQRRWEEIDETA